MEEKNSSELKDKKGIESKKFRISGTATLSVSKEKEVIYHTYEKTMILYKKSPPPLGEKEVYFLRSSLTSFSLVMDWVSLIQNVKFQIQK